ncbi:MAG: endonuclease III domain-containing protein [Desulfonatronovibrionaceae bacterium]
MGQKLKLLKLYSKLMDRLGPSNWWPGDSPFEVAVGAVLTQNTNWGNVEKAISNLKDCGLMHPEKMFRLDQGRLSELIRPAGYFRVKAERLKNFLTFLHLNFDLDMNRLRNENTAWLRRALLKVKGIGPETADSILLYALDHPVFVIDAYTKRIFSRHGLMEQDRDYSEFQEFVMGYLPPDRALYNEYHALLVRAGKNWCKKTKPLCAKCPLETLQDA